MYKTKGSRTPTPQPIYDSSSDSSDEGAMVGSPKRARAAKSAFKVDPDDQILSGSVRSASYNIIFQVFIVLTTTYIPCSGSI